MDGMEGTLKEMISLGEEVSAELGSGNTEWSVPDELSDVPCV